MNFKFLFRKNLIRKFIAYFILLVILPISAIYFFLSYKLSAEATNIAGELIYSNLKSISVDVDEIFRNAEFSYRPFFLDEQWIGYTKGLKVDWERSGYDENVLPLKILNYMQDVKIRNNYIESIHMYDYNGKTFFSTQSNLLIINNFPLEKSSWYAAYKNIGENERWVINRFSDNSDLEISDFMEFKDFAEIPKIGLMSINLGVNTINDILEKNELNATGFFLVTDDHGSIISNLSNATPALTKIILGDISAGEGKKFTILSMGKEPQMAVWYTSPYLGFTYILVSPLQVVNKTYATISLYVILTYFLLLIILAAVILLVYINLYRPVREITNAMKRLEKGDFSVRLKDKRLDELGYIGFHFNTMTTNLKKLIDDNYANQLLKKDAQLKSVLSQINQHFLYNTLDAIHWSARQYNAPVVCDIIFSLSKFYRLNLSYGKDFLPCRQIVELIDCYIDIQKFRMQEDLTFEMSVDERLYDEKVLKYLFLPLVENAVIHGIEKKDGGGWIKVSFRLEDSRVRFEVEDNGAGIRKEKLAAILEDIHGNQDALESNFALKNINSQIRLYYGEEWPIQIESAENVGTRVWFSFNLINEKVIGDVQTLHH